MPNLWDMTDEEISQLSNAEIERGGYLWSPDRKREARTQETVREAARAAKQDPSMHYRPPGRIHDASRPGVTTIDPGGWERRVDASQPQGGLAAMIAQAGGDQDVIDAAKQIDEMPGGMELLTSYAAEEMMKAQGIPKKDAKKIRLYQLGGGVHQSPARPGEPAAHMKRSIPHKAAYEKGAHGHNNYARGGSTKNAARRTRAAGRGDDSMMLHMSPEEYEVITSMWGAPDINPNTGIGEYGFLSKVWKKVKKGVKKVFKSKIFRIVAPIALSVFAPGIGTAIGLKLGLSGAAASIAGNAVVQGGLGAITGGKEGALRGAVSGGLGAAAGAYGKAAGEAIGLSGKTAEVVGSGLIQGTGEQLTGGDFTSGAITGGLSAAQRPMQERMGRDVRRTMGFEADVPEGQMFAQREPAPTDLPAPELPAAPVVTPDPAAVGQPPPEISPTVTVGGVPQGTEPRLTLPQLASKYALPIGMTALGAAGAGAGYEDEPPPWWGRQGDNTFGENLPVYTMNRQFRGLPNQADYFTYGQPGSPQSGQHLFMAPEPFAGEQGTPTAPPTGLAAVVAAGERARRSGGLPERLRGRTGSTEFVAEGGYQRGGEFDYWEQNADVPNAIPTVSREGGHKVKGPGTGRSDDIPAMLSDGEYVIDAETVALLGDGSGDAGSKRLDEMRRELRKHKAQKLKKGEFTHKARKPTGYMRNVRKLRRNAKYEHGGTANVAGTSPLPPTRVAGSNI